MSEFTPVQRQEIKDLIIEEHRRYTGWLEETSRGTLPAELRLRILSFARNTFLGIGGLALALGSLVVWANNLIIHPTAERIAKEEAQTIAEEIAEQVQSDAEKALDLAKSEVDDVLEDARRTAEQEAQRTAANVNSAEVANRLRDDPDFQSAVLSILDNSVVAFDDQCPNGWVNVGQESPRRFSGRVIVAAGPENSRDRISRRDPNDIGGAERVVLEEAHMPSHSHSTVWADGVIYPTSVATTGSRGAVGAAATDNNATSTGEIGGGESHENMPPYIVLRFCKKVK